ncbi:MAG TPA: DUF4410 domain-containing protein [Verrucomicrobiae bacterium]|nr:DUF4410 domain-containing protein [Verrucomicrobiae bacterium]
MKRRFGGRIVLSITVVLIAGLFAAKTACGQSSAAPTPIKASAIQIQQIQSEDVKLPVEFQMSMYEHVVEEVTKTKRFQHVYRDGDKSAADAPDLVTLQCTVTGFKQGSAMERQVTTVAGSTSITVHTQFLDKNGRKLFENDVKGKVMFFGENLRATYNFSKQVAAVVRQDFVAQNAKK